MKRWYYAVTASLLLLATGVVHGFWTDRWGSAAEPQEAAAKLDDIPLAVGDWQERAYWDEYQMAYEEVLSRCATAEAPWHIVPADKKWYRDAFIAQAIVERLEPYERRWERELEARGKQERAAIEEYRRQQQAHK